MSIRTTPVIIWILHLKDEELKHIPKITRLDIMDGSSLEPHPDGLFSTRIFGEFGTPERDKLFGKIDLKVKIIHPKLYRDLMSLRQLYREIINGNRYATFNKRTGDFDPAELGDVNAGTGYSFFIKHLKDLKLHRTQSIDRNEKINAIEKWRHRLMVKNWPVLPAGLRDIEISNDGRVTKNEINDFYYRILATTLVIVESDDMEDEAYDGVRRSLQNAINDLYEFLSGLSGGKRGFLNDKFLSRRVMDGTRNVITAMDAAGADLDSPNVPNFTSTVFGLYQASRALAPKYVHWLLQGPLRKLVSFSESGYELIDPKTLKRVWVSIHSDIVDSFVSEQGLMELIHQQSDIEARHRPIDVGGYYLALVAISKVGGWFKVFDDIDDLPDNYKSLYKKGEVEVHPITLEELIYYAGYNQFASHYSVNIRYPGTDDNSIYPTTYYVKTTTTSLTLRELNDDWELVESDDSNLAVEWPMSGVHTYHDGHSPHSSRLGWSAADFDGDTMSSTALMSDSALKELDDYQNTRNAWITPDGQMRATISYDTSELVFKNLTGGFDHVSPLDDVSIPAIAELMRM